MEGDKTAIGIFIFFIEVFNQNILSLKIEQIPLESISKRNEISIRDYDGYFHQR